MASATILDTFLRLIADTAPTVVDGDTQWRFRLSLTLTLLAIGVPIWWTHWRRIQSAASADPATEGAALPRRLYLLGVLSLGLLALAGSAGSTLFLFLRDLLDSELSAATLRDLATSLAIALTALAAIPSHWAIYRRDRELDVDTPPAPAPQAGHAAERRRRLGAQGPCRGGARIPRDGRPLAGRGRLRSRAGRRRAGARPRGRRRGQRVPTSSSSPSRQPSGSSPTTDRLGYDFLGA